jgi:2-polyprenyl-3-methyl-5-hydroxy-6-metoxy-1,4-benzoquinol methylase
MINAQTGEFAEKHGEWTAMAIKLPDGTYTRRPAADHRLRRLLQAAQDTVRKPLSECRVLDLACLEGHYALEFGLHGAEVIGIEGRQVNVDKCNFAKDALALERVTFVTDDVRHLSVEKYGRFDIVLCSGILYHLPAADAAQLLRSIAEVCSGILLLDTFIAMSGQTSLKVFGRWVYGHNYSEHEPNESDESKASKLWASIGNAASFWFTEATLINLLMDAGFTSVSDVLVPNMPGNFADRKTYLAIRGHPFSIRSSDITQNEPSHPLPEGINTLFDPSQRPPSTFFRIAKRILPSIIKNAIKPALRAVKVLPPDTTPDFMRNRRE